MRFRQIALYAFGLIVALLAVRKAIAVVHRQPNGSAPFAYAYVPSPNFDDRPIGASIDCIVLHSTVEPTTEATVAIFLDPKKKVSAHFVVGKDGRVVQMVPLEKRAWHAGVSELKGVERVNDYSIGIEMVNKNDARDPYTPEQLESVAGIIRFVRSYYSVPDDRIVSHAQIALPQGRKSDPAGFDFEKLKSLVKASDPAGDDKSVLPGQPGDAGLPRTDAKPGD